MDIGLAVAWYSLAFAAFAAAHYRSWQTGILLDSKLSAVYLGAASEASTNGAPSAPTTGSAHAAADETSGADSSHSSGDRAPVYKTSEVEVIQADPYVYIVARGLRWPWNRAANVTVDATVRFAVDQQTMYLLDGDGHEHKTTILKRTPMLAGLNAVTPPAAVPGSPASASVTPMTNQDVLALKLAGFSDELIVAKIKAVPGSYQTDTDDIIALKKSNVSEAVIQAMMAAGAPGARSAPRVPKTVAAAPNSAPAEPGPVLTSVTILSKPAGATILVDGYTAGRTPAVVKLQPGTYNLTLKADGFPDYSQQITVELGQVKSFGVALDGSK